MSKCFVRIICNSRSPIQLYINKIASYLCIVVLLSARIQDHQLNVFTSVILSYKSIIYKSLNKPNQSIFLTMSLSPNTRNIPPASIKTIYIAPPMPPTSSTSTSRKKNSGLDKFSYNMKSMTDSIAVILVKLYYTGLNTYNQEEKITEISSKISTYEDHIF